MVDCCPMLIDFVIHFLRLLSSSLQPLTFAPSHSAGYKELTLTLRAENCKKILPPFFLCAHRKIYLKSTSEFSGPSRNSNSTISTLMLSFSSRYCSILTMTVLSRAVHRCWPSNSISQLPLSWSPTLRLQLHSLNRRLQALLWRGRHNLPSGCRRCFYRRSIIIPVFLFFFFAHMQLREVTLCQQHLIRELKPERHEVREQISPVEEACRKLWMVQGGACQTGLAPCDGREQVSQWEGRLLRVWKWVRT